MYLHIGNGQTIKKKHIIGIFDLDNATVSSTTRRLIKDMEKRGHISYTDDDLPRSFIFYEDREKTYKIQLSRISVSGLLGRAKRRMTDMNEG